MIVRKMIFLFNWVILSFDVHLPECNKKTHPTGNTNPPVPAAVFSTEDVLSHLSQRDPEFGRRFFGSQVLQHLRRPRCPVKDVHGGLSE